MTDPITPTPVNAPLAEVMEIIRACLMTRAGIVIDEHVAEERARNCAQAVAHLVRGSGYP
jgi:hypothetical protein